MIQIRFMRGNILLIKGIAAKAIAACQLGKDVFQKGNSLAAIPRISKGLSLKSNILSKNAIKVQSAKLSHKGKTPFLFLLEKRNITVAITKTAIPEPIKLIKDIKESNQPTRRESTQETIAES